MCDPLAPPSAAAEQYARGQAMAKTLPEDIQEILKRKSSRDPSSRFSRKLHALLSYVDAVDPSLAEEFGLGWIDDQVFRIYKARLLGVMGIKLNTLNVNLRDLHFVQLQGDKNMRGWTTWRKDGFTKRSYSLPITDRPVVPLAEGDMFDAHLKADPIVDKMVGVGRLTQQQFDELQQMVLQEWTVVLGSDEMITCDARFFVGRAAQRYKQPKQPLKNAFDVLTAILAPQDKMEISYGDFFRFMAMFGPAETVMLKIHSLLEVATAGTPWLYFGITPTVEDGGVFGFFDDAEANALVIHDGKGGDRVWNLPFVPAGEIYQYVEDKEGRKYTSWKEYFRDYPVSEPQSFEVVDMAPYGVA